MGKSVFLGSTLDKSKLESEDKKKPSIATLFGSGVNRDESFLPDPDLVIVKLPRPVIPARPRRQTEQQLKAAAEFAKIEELRKLKNLQEKRRIPFHLQIQEPIFTEEDNSVEENQGADFTYGT